MRDYQTKTNLTGSNTPAADYLNAGEANSYLDELKNFVALAGLTVANAAGVGETFAQLGEAASIMGMGGAEWCIDTGAADAYVVAPINPRHFIAPPAYFVGMTISFAPSATNLTTTPEVTYNSISSEVIEEENFGSCTIGAIRSGVPITMRWNGSKWKITRRTSHQNTDAPALSLTEGGYIQLPLGVDGFHYLLQWGYDEGSIYTAPTTVTFPTAFNVGCLAVVGIDHQTVAVPPVSFAVFDLQLTTFKFIAPSTQGGMWFAIGY